MAGGIGGVWYYSLDEGADTIRLPETRGDFSRDAGGRKGESANDGVYGVGEWHGDAIRNITGRAWNKKSYTDKNTPASGIADEFEGAFIRATETNAGAVSMTSSTPPNKRFGIKFDASLAVPTAHENRPRAGMLLGCVYVGR